MCFHLMNLSKYFVETELPAKRFDALFLASPGRGATFIFGAYTRNLGFGGKIGLDGRFDLDWRFSSVEHEVVWWLLILSVWMKNMKVFFYFKSLEI